MGRSAASLSFGRDGGIPIEGTTPPPRDGRLLTAGSGTLALTPLDLGESPTPFDRFSSAGRLVALDEVDERRRAEGAGDPPGALEAAARNEQLRLVRAALLTLPERERAALVPRDLEGRPSPEVARILGSSEGTVRSQVASARLKIKRFVESRSRAGRGVAGKRGGE